jgi:hypothetical protein
MTMNKNRLTSEEAGKLQEARNLLASLESGKFGDCAISARKLIYEVLYSAAPIISLNYGSITRTPPYFIENFIDDDEGWE